MSWGSWNVDAIRRQIHEVARELVVTGDGDGHGNVHGLGRGYVNGQGRGQAGGGGAEGAAVAGRPGIGIGIGIGASGDGGNDNGGSSFQTMSATAAVATRDDYNPQSYNSTKDEHGDDEDLKTGRLDDIQAEGTIQRKGLDDDDDNDSDADTGDDNNDDGNVGVSGSDDGNPPFFNSHSNPSVGAQKDRYRFQEQQSHRQEQPQHAAHTKNTRDSKLRLPHASPSSADKTLLSSSPMPPSPSPPSASSVTGDNSVIIGSSSSGPSMRVSEDIAFLKIELAKSQSSLAMLRAHLIEQQRDSESTILEMKVHLSEEQERRQYLEEIAMRVPQLESELAQLRIANDSLRNQSASVEQLVEQFHVDKENDFQLRSFHLKQELEALSNANKHLRGELQSALDERDAHASAQGRLELVESQLVHATSTNNQLRQELERLRRNLDEVAGELASNTQTREDLVDKRVVVKLITTYFQQQSAANKTQVLDLMSRILNFSDNEKRIVGLLVDGGSTGGNGNNVIHNAGRRSWLSSIFSGGGGGAIAPVRGDHNNSGGDGDTANQSLSALWVKFLVDQAEAATEAETGATGT